MPISFHPYADLFPLIEGAEFAELVADIKANDLRERIVVLDGSILDGRNRYLAALAAGLIEDDDGPDRTKYFVRFVPAVDGDPLSFVFSKNIHRRHLSTGQRAYIMAEYETFRHGGQRKPTEQDANLRLETAPIAPVETRAELAEKGHVSERSIASAAVVRDYGVDDLKSAVKQGDVPISVAEKIARLEPEEQPRELAKHLPNGARSIMGSRQEPDDSLDYFPTPPWATRALCEVVLPAIGPQMGRRPDCSWQSIWEPACGEGHIAEVLREYSANVTATDVFDYGYGDGVADFLDTNLVIAHADWIVTNPPFGDNAIKFVHRARHLARVGIAMFFRSQWAVEGIERYETIFRDHPPTLCAFFVERVNLCKGRWDPDGTTATAYCWLIWVCGKEPLPPFWIPPGQRQALTHPDDAERFTAHPVKRGES